MDPEPTRQAAKCGSTKVWICRKADGCTRSASLDALCLCRSHAVRHAVEANRGCSSRASDRRICIFCYTMVPSERRKSFRAICGAEVASAPLCFACRCRGCRLCRATECASSAESRCLPSSNVGCNDLLCGATAAGPTPLPCSPPATAGRLKRPPGTGKRRRSSAEIPTSLLR